MNTINKINDMNSGIDFNSFYTKHSIYDSIYTNDKDILEIDDMSEGEWLEYIVGGERVVEPYKDRLKRDNKKRLDMGERLNMSRDTMKILSKEGYDRIRVSDQQVIEDSNSSTRYRLTLLHNGVVEVEEKDLGKYDMRGVVVC